MPKYWIFCQHVFFISERAFIMISLLSYHQLHVLYINSLHLQVVTISNTYVWAFAHKYNFEDMERKINVGYTTIRHSIRIFIFYFYPSTTLLYKQSHSWHLYFITHTLSIITENNSFIYSNYFPPILTQLSFIYYI